MNEDKLLGLQMQVRQNQQELMDYVKELDGWGDEMKLKEQQLKQETHSCSEVSVILVYFVLVTVICFIVSAYWKTVQCRKLVQRDVLDINNNIICFLPQCYFSSSINTQQCSRNIRGKPLIIML